MLSKNRFVFKQASADHGKSLDVKAILDTWILQMNFPVVTISKMANGHIKLTQERFLKNRDAKDPGVYTSEFGLVALCLLCKAKDSYTETTISYTHVVRSITSSVHLTACMERPQVYKMRIRRFLKITQTFLLTYSQLFYYKQKLCFFEMNGDDIFVQI